MKYLGDECQQLALPVIHADKVTEYYLVDSFKYEHQQ